VTYAQQLATYYNVLMIYHFIEAEVKEIRLKEGSKEIQA